jgi:hypothetical protein
MKILASAIAVTAILTSPMYAATAPHQHRAAASVKRPPIVGVVIPKGGVFLLENRAVGTGNASRNFQDNFAISY